MKKKVRIVVMSAAGAALLGTAVWLGTTRKQKTVVDVYALSELSQPIWGESTTLEGSVSSHVVQEVRLLDNQIVSKVHVQEGQEVQEGDALLSYDMTLVNIDLEMEKLNKQQLEIKKNGLEQELKKLKDDRNLLRFRTGTYELDYLDGKEDVWKMSETAAEEVPEPEPPAEEEIPPQDEPSAEEEVPPQDEPSAEEEIPPQDEPSAEEEIPPQDEPPAEEEIPPQDEPSAEEEIPPQDVPPEGEQPPEETPVPMPSGAYKCLYGDVNMNAEDFPEEDVIRENAVPYKGKGTKEEPFVFLCKKEVVIQGDFLNKLAGFGPYGEREREPAYCELEVRSEDSQEGFLLAAMRIDGAALQQMLQPDRWFATGLGKKEWEDIIPEEDVPQEEIMELPDGTGDYFPEEAIISGYSREELDKAIGEKERQIVTAGLDIRDAELKVQKTAQQLQDETVKSTINGVVKKVGDAAKGEIDGEPFIVVESGGGVYVQGRVAEDMLGEVKAGQTLSGMAYESGMMFEAEVKEVSPYPVSDYYMYSDREISYYPFTAFIQNSEGLKDNEMVSMNMPQQEGAITGVFVSKEYVRSKNGQDFVYKEGKDGKLQKQTVKTGRTFYGSLMEIKEGITTEDYIAFPYGKKVKDGVKVRRSSLSELYNMY